MRWHRKGRTPAPGEERCLTKQKMAWARDSLCLKWCVGERAGVNQYPSHLTTPEGWKSWPASSMEAVTGTRLSFMIEFDTHDVLCLVSSIV